MTLGSGQVLDTAQMRREAWTPPPRQDWVATFNAEADNLDTRQIVPLDLPSLIASASANTGLSDFGDEHWRPHLEFICAALEAEADLTFIGRIAARAHLLNVLEGRLRIEDAYRRHPEIDDEVIAEPIFIIGSGRSGTSMLQNLLAEDPDNGYLATWEAMFPVPPDEGPDDRIGEADRLIRLWERIVPESVAVHEFTAQVPAECVQIQSYSGLSRWFALLGQIGSYTQYMATADWVPGYHYHKRVLKLLQWYRPRQRWLLKAPSHIMRLPQLFAEYPDASLLWPHRDPVQSVASFTNLAGTWNWISSDRPRVASWEHLTDPHIAAAMLEKPIDWLESGEIPAQRVFNVNYNDLVEDPLGTVESVYAHYGWEFGDRGRAAIDGYLAAHPRSSRPAHRYSKGTDEIVDYERGVFKRYTDYFNVPPEV